MNISSLNSLQVSNPYIVLGVPEDSSHEEIKKTYQRLVLKLHPDKLDGSLSNEDREKAHQKFLAIDQAWRMLCDKETRKNCDRQLREHNLSQGWPVGADIDLDEMEYHEDSGNYTSPCRCSGEYVITDSDLEDGHSIVCCSNCTLSVRILYSVLNNEASDEEQKEFREKMS